MTISKLVARIFDNSKSSELFRNVAMRLKLYYPYNVYYMYSRKRKLDVDLPVVPDRFF